jgi:SAM-dependent methyltransferase
MSIQMNRNKPKTYAPQARRDFIQAVTQQAAHYGLTAKKTEPMTEKGDVVVISGQPFPKAIGEKRKKLEARIQKNGFGPTMEAMAYTWFNRLVAIRFMELHGYLEHGFRVLSHPSGGSQPEIVEHAQHVNLPGLDQQKVVALKLDGTREEELYRLVLVAQCNALHKALPFLFEKIDDETELLLPDKLLHSDSLIRKLVSEIDEDDWQEVEIIGWLYQFYISERKDEVIGKVVASEDIPAATQLFTPNWIVKYLVQNTLGRQWLATYPQSALRQKMKYYIEPAEQTPEVQEQLKVITPTELNPEELTLLDPACGSGHILVEAYDLFKAIYEERGRRPKDIPTLILTKNLFGLEIDDRAAQLAAFALMMKARADDRRIFDAEAKPNILALQESKGINADEITFALNSPISKEESQPSEYLIEEVEDSKAPLFSKKMMAEKGHVSQADIASLVALFENAKAFGSLIQISPTLTAKLPEIEKRLDDVLKHGGTTHAPVHVLRPILQQARLLVRQYDAVVANPPYMGGKYYSPNLKVLVNREYSDAKGDLYACFIQRNSAFAKPGGFVGMITIPNWMFLASFEEVRTALLSHQTINTFVHNGRGIFGSDFGSCAFTFCNTSISEFRGSYRRLFDKQGSVASNEELEERFHTSINHTPSNSEFSKIPGSPLAYWVSNSFRSTFIKFPAAENFFFSDGLTKTGNNDRFLRTHWEVRSDHASDNKCYRFCAKGGPALRYYGNSDTLINWSKEARDHYRSDFVARISPEYVWTLPGVTWTDISARYPTFRLMSSGFISETAGPVVFPKNEENDIFWLLGCLHCPFAFECFKLLNPTVHTKTFDVLRLPMVPRDPEIVTRVKSLVEIARLDWDSFETSWDFQTIPVIHHKAVTLQQSQEAVDTECHERFRRMKELEEENNRLLIDAYGLQGELSPAVPDEQITLHRPDRPDDIKRLLSYAIGCMMGRYSLDKHGLIYAQSGNQGFDASQYKTFRSDEDGIIPLTDFEWFSDDAASRFEQFIRTAWPAEHLEENLKFVAESLGAKKGESPQETIRRYLAADFYKHHLSMYKKRPIYWLFSSGKQRGFQALVYLHRYNEGTLSRMRTEYVVPLLGKMTARISHLTDDIAAASSSQHKKRLETEKATVTKQLAEVQAFEEKLRHCADQRISLELDDGVKVNYGKFGDLLAEVKAICGSKDEED